MTQIGIKFGVSPIFLTCIYIVGLYFLVLSVRFWKVDLKLNNLTKWKLWFRKETYCLSEGLTAMFEITMYRIWPNFGLKRSNITSDF